MANGMHSRMQFDLISKIIVIHSINKEKKSYDHLKRHKNFLDKVKISDKISQQMKKLTHLGKGHL